jgi:hypothetical protein
MTIAQLLRACALAAVVVGLAPRGAPAFAAVKGAAAPKTQTAPLPAVPGGVGPPEPPLDYIVSLAAGSSRGAYQAGVAYALAANFRSAPDTKPDALMTRAPGNVRGFAGASIGAVNAVLAAVTMCESQVPLTVDDNPLWNFWSDVDWNRLFAGDRSCGQYAHDHPELSVVCANPDGPAYGPNDGIFTTMGLAPLRQRIMRLLTLRGEATLRAGCSVPVTFMLATDRGGAFQKAYTLDKLQFSTSRRMTGFELRVVDSSPGNREIAVCDLSENRSDDIFVHLPSAAPPPPSAEPNDAGVAPNDAGAAPNDASAAPNDASAAPGHSNECRRLALKPVVDAILASAAAAPMQLPQPVTFCAESCEPSAATGLYCPTGMTLCQGRFSDGATFDRKPLAAAARIQQALEDLNRPPTSVVSHVVIDADELRRPGPKPQNTAGAQPRGAAYISREARNFGKVIDDLELQMMSRYGQLKQVRLDPTTRYAPIVGATGVFESVPPFSLVATGSAAFFDVDFRRHDFYVGLYDGIRWLAEQTQAYCQTLHADDQRCVDHGRPLRTWQDWAQIMATKVGARDKPAAKKILNAVGRCEGVRLDDSPVADPAVEAAAEGVPQAAQCVLDLCSPEAAPQCRVGTPTCVVNACSLEAVAKGSVDARKCVVEACSPEAVGNGADEWVDPCAPEIVAKGSIEARLCVIVRALRGPEDVDPKFGQLAEALRKSGEYPEDNVFVENRPPYVANYDQWQWTVARQALRRMEALERMDDSQGTAAAAAGAEFLTAVGAGRRALKLGVGPSSVPERFDTGSPTSALLAKLLIPSVLTDDLRHGGLRLGWEPVSYGWKYSRLFLTGQFQWQRYPVDPDERYAVGGALGYSLNGVRCRWIPEAGVRAGTWYMWNLPGDKIDRFRLASEVFWRPLWGQVELYAGLRGSNCLHHGAAGCSDTVVAGFGVADLNGLLYWVLRAAFGSDDTYAWLGGQLGGKATSVIP